MKNKGTKYLVGCDPEVFLYSTTGAQGFVSAHDIVKGTKEEPFPVPGGSIQKDGTSAEFNIIPASSAEEFTTHIKQALTSLQNEVQKVNRGLSIKVVPVAVFEKEYFKNLPESAKAFGCQADFNAHTSKMTTFKGTKEPFRTGAGHLHMGWTEAENILDDSHIYDCEAVTKQLDASLYLMSLLWDDDDKRRSLYGLMGAYRPKTYGVEYRSLSNVFVKDPDLHRYVFEASVRAATLLDEGTELFDETWGKYLIRTIREGLTLSKETLLNYHNHLVEQYKFPTLPTYYLEADQ